MVDRSILTNNDIYNTAVALVGTDQKRITDFSVGSYNRSFIQMAAWFAEFLQSQVNLVDLGNSAQFALDSDLDLLVGQFGMSRIPAEASRGIMTFSVDSPAVIDTTISAGSLVTTEADAVGNSFTFATEADLTLASGDSTVTGYVTCTVTGTDGNVAASAVINHDISGIDSAINTEAFDNGRFTETNEELRLRIPNYLIGLRKGNTASILNAAYGVAGVSYATIIENSPDAGNYQLYIANTNASGSISQTTLEEVSGEVALVTNAGVTYSVITGTVTYLTVEITLTTNQVYTTTSIRTRIRSLIKDYVNNQFKTRTLYRSILSQYLLNNMYGVIDISPENIKFARSPDAATAVDITLVDQEILLVNALGDVTVTITEV